MVRMARLRLSVFRSNKYIWAQIIDDQKQQTLVSASEKDIAVKESNKTERARFVGKMLAQKAKKRNIKTVFLDRGRFKYKGRVKALAEGARGEGLQF